MKTATISQTKNQLSAILDAVRHGETVVITDRNQPIARIEPISAGDGEGDDKLKRLERRGLLRRGSGKSVKIILTPPPSLKRGVSAVAALISERNDGR
jgi:prevent-host-death family protein